MKKFLALMCSVLVLCLLSFAGCSDGWTEVQSITYSVGGETTTYTSKICYYGTSEEIDQATYESAPGEQKKDLWGGLPEGYPRYESISVNRKTAIAEAKERSGQTMFCSYTYKWGYPVEYRKETISSYEIQYVKFKPSDGNNIEISYYQNGESRTIRVFPTSYEITYFED